MNNKNNKHNKKNNKYNKYNKNKILILNNYCKNNKNIFKI